MILKVLFIFISMTFLLNNYLSSLKVMADNNETLPIWKQKELEGVSAN